MSTAVAKSAATWVRVRVETSNPNPGRAADVKQCAGSRGDKVSFEGHAEQGDREQCEQQEVEKAQAHVEELLAQQEFEARCRRDVEIDDRAQVLFAHYRKRGQHGRNQEQ